MTYVFNIFFRMSKKKKGQDRIGKVLAYHKTVCSSKNKLNNLPLLCIFKQQQQQKTYTPIFLFVIIIPSKNKSATLLQSAVSHHTFVIHSNNDLLFKRHYLVLKMYA